MTVFDQSERAVAMLAGIGLLALVVGILTAGALGGTQMMGGSGMMGGAGFLPFVFLPLMFLSLAALLALGYVGIRALAEGSEGDPIGGSPIDREVDGDGEIDTIARLKRRYTEGDLTEAEFERALDRELSGGATSDDGETESVEGERSVSARE